MGLFQQAHEQNNTERSLTSNRNSAHLSGNSFSPTLLGENRAVKVEHTA